MSVVLYFSEDVVVATSKELLQAVPSVHEQDYLQEY